MFFAQCLLLALMLGKQPCLLFAPVPLGGVQLLGMAHMEFAQKLLAFALPALGISPPRLDLALRGVALPARRGRCLFGQPQLLRPAGMFLFQTAMALIELRK